MSTRNEHTRASGMPMRRGGARRTAGFSLIELMLALSLGAVLLTTVASMTGSMGATMAQLQSESTDSYDKAMARMARDVRYAWWVDVPTRTQLRIADSQNRVTEYYRVGNSMLVRLPSGEEGAVITGLDGVTFVADTMQRLRNSAIRPVSGRLHGVTAPTTASGGLKMVPGNSVALAFIARGDGGEGDVAGVRENVTALLPTRFDVPIAKVTGAGSFLVEIYSARAPGDARPIPGAAPITSFTVNFLGLPLATVLIPSSNPLDPTLAIYGAPDTQLPLAIPAFTPFLQPGTAYSVVITIQTGSMGILAGHVSTTGNNPAVQWRQWSGVGWTPMAAVVPFAIHGEQKLTSTSATDVARSVRIELDPSTADPRTSTVVVHSQVMADDAWLGVIPGESAP
jgi:prepilin-type N-terminal cleavage/methylation domain-containing protein